jgi:hypothetical protein
LNFSLTFYEKWSLTVSEAHKLAVQVFEIRMLMRIFVLKKADVLFYTGHRVLPWFLIFRKL